LNEVYGETSAEGVNTINKTITDLTAGMSTSTKNAVYGVLNSIDWTDAAAWDSL
jgi:hypothetical protein